MTVFWSTSSRTLPLRPTCSANFWSIIRCGSIGPSNKETTDVARQTLYGYPGYHDLRCRHVAAGLSSQPVLHVADEGGEPRALQGRRARLSRRMADDRGPEAGG